MIRIAFVLLDCELIWKNAQQCSAVVSIGSNDGSLFGKIIYRFELAPRGRMFLLFNKLLLRARCRTNVLTTRFDSTALSLVVFSSSANTTRRTSHRDDNRHNDAPVSWWAHRPVTADASGGVQNRSRLVRTTLGSSQSQVSLGNPLSRFTPEYQSAGKIGNSRWRQGAIIND